MASVSFQLSYASGLTSTAAFAYHGFNGLEREVIAQIATWILAK